MTVRIQQLYHDSEKTQDNWETVSRDNVIGERKLRENKIKPNSLAGQELCTQCFISEAVTCRVEFMAATAALGRRDPTYRPWHCSHPVLCSCHCWCKPIYSFLQLYFLVTVLCLLSNVVTDVSLCDFLNNICLDWKHILLFQFSRPAPLDTSLGVYWIHPKPLDIVNPGKQSHCLHTEANIPFSKASLERKWSTTAPKSNTVVQNLPEWWTGKKR